MSSEDITLVPDQRIENGLSSPLVFQDDPLRFNCPTPQRRVGDPGPKTRELGAFIDEKMFIDRDRFFAAQNPDFRRYADCSSRQDPRNWTVNGTAATPSEDDESDEDDEDDEDEDDDEGDTEVEGLVGGGSKREIIANNNGGGGNLPSVANGKAHAFVSGRELLGKDGGEIGQLVLSNVNGGGDEDHRQEGLGKSQNSVTVADTDCEEYYSHYLQGADGASGHKVMVDDGGCGFSGRKDAMYSTESGESLRNILSDPVTKLAAPVLNPQPRNQYLLTYAYRREEESQFYRSPKRRRERFDQGGFGDSSVMEPSRSRGVQFPYAVMDRVVIKGNKRTPQRFVGREAIVTTQCLNGWYVVKTLDNAESVKFQYRSLAKVLDDPSKPSSSKMSPNWL
ncbi:U-box domain-containing protein 62 isoform X2 [Vigna umbellata]|uniref:U-box domain-containing protein 62 isoform X2 n=1 Tax=Vigna umbellata TaxID=87088 RepID=UPI001F5EEF3F|nr:U-box domain-containing protein 62 isoform X2 [Vigna umbellata]